MTTLELNSQKLAFVKEFLNEEDEILVRELMSSFMKAKQESEPIPGVPRTVEELRASVARAMEQHKQGLGYSNEEVFAKYNL